MISNVVDEEVMVSFEYHTKSFEGSKEIITLGINLEDGVKKTTQNHLISINEEQCG
jgi:hypothetical protein